MSIAIILLIGAGLMVRVFGADSRSPASAGRHPTGACRWRDPLSRQPEIAAFDENAGDAEYKAGVKSAG